jgi:hypothetical protein
MVIVRLHQVEQVRFTNKADSVETDPAERTEKERISYRVLSLLIPERFTKSAFQPKRMSLSRFNRVGLVSETHHPWGTIQQSAFSS